MGEAKRDTRAQLHACTHPRTRHAARTHARSPARSWRALHAKRMKNTSPLHAVQRSPCVRSRQHCCDVTIAAHWLAQPGANEKPSRKLYRDVLPASVNLGCWFGRWQVVGLLAARDLWYSPQLLIAHKSSILFSQETGSTARWIMLKHRFCLVCDFDFFSSFRLTRINAATSWNANSKSKILSLHAQQWQKIRCKLCTANFFP